MNLRKPEVWICLAIFLSTLGLYSAVRHFEFVDFDDPYYAGAPQVRNGVTPDAVKWTFTSTDAANWLPLTRLSHLADYQLYGPQSGPPHIENAVIHAFTCVLLFLFLRRATQAQGSDSLWRSAFVAFVFAWHPLHVESVAWVAERKDVLCGLFWFLTLLLWVRYAERPSRARYAWALVAFCCGLMSKPMIVTLPFVLLLIDLWPLRRPVSWKLAAEKAPFLAIAAAGSLTAYFAQGRAGAVVRIQSFPLGLRFANVLLSYAIYAGKTIWPSNLACWYPYPASIPWWQASLCGVALLAVSLGALRAFATRPWLTTGWFWFVGTLVPVIGLVQVGAQARADRYMYIPMAGLLIALAWSVDPRRAWVRIAGVVACLALLPLAWLQIRTWRDSRSLFVHATEATTANYIAWNNLGSMALKIPGRESEALVDFENARRAFPAYAPAWYNSGTVLMNEGRLEEAKADFEEAVRLNPAYADARNNLARVLEQEGRVAEALPHLRAAARLMPESAKAQRNLGNALLLTGHVNQAIERLEAAVELAPEDADGHNLLGYALALGGSIPDAIDHLREAIRINPNLASAHANLGRLLAQTPNGRSEAISELEIASRLDPADRGIKELLVRLK